MNKCLFIPSNNSELFSIDFYGPARRAIINCIAFKCNPIGFIRFFTAEICSFVALIRGFVISNLH